MTSTTLPLLHFNDVYRVQPFKLDPSKPEELIDVTQFAAMLEDIRASWPERQDTNAVGAKARDGLVLFSGDVFSPSVESSVTRGSHMVPVMNYLLPDISMCGNHDFDFGYPHLTKLIKDTKFPWLLSNIIDTNTGKVPENLYEYWTLERRGVRIGVIGLVEKEWIGTVSNWPPNFEYRDMAESAKDLSRRLRDPQGEYKVDIVIALTHARVPNDLALAKAVNALSSSGQKNHSISDEHGVDLLLGGHDHLYFVSRGVDAWENYDLNQTVLGAEADDGSVLVIKSGMDFRDLSSFDLELVDTPEGSVRRKLIKSIKGIHHATKPNSKKSQELTTILKDVISSVSSSLKAPVCKSSVQLDVRSQYIRTAESAAANWFADIVQHAYDGTLAACPGGKKTVDMVFICAGMLRGDSVYGPGDITLGDILEILPFEDPLVVIEVDGETIWKALEAGLSTWPAQEGRFPVISGVRVEWDSKGKPGERVRSVKVVKEGGEDGEEVKKDGSGKYVVLTREYMAQGHDGFDALKGHRFLVDDESGQMMSAIVRKYLLGSLYVHRLARQNSLAVPPQLQESTSRILHTEREKQKQHKPASAAKLWRIAASKALHGSRQHQHYRDHIGVAEREHMSEVDIFDGDSVRRGRGEAEGQGKREVSQEREGDLLTIHPGVDGRLKDVARA